MEHTDKKYLEEEQMNAGGHNSTNMPTRMMTA